MIQRASLIDGTGRRLTAHAAGDASQTATATAVLIFRSYAARNYRTT